MLDPRDIRITPRMMKIFWASVLIFYAAFLILSNAIIVIFGLLYSMEYAALLVFAEIIVNLLFIKYYLKNRKSVKKQFYLMLALAVFSALLFVIIALLTKIFVAP
jgi:hypothetical protein